MEKYRRLAERVAHEVRPPGGLHTPPPASDVQLLRVHSRDWVARVSRGDLDAREVRGLGFPWSPELVARSRCSVGATVAAVHWALETGSAGVNLAGGTHHAFRDRGEGFCVFNDAAVAAADVLATGAARFVLVVDCDVHQGNGTAAIFRDEPRVFTLSVHGARNYPLRKETSDLDVALPDGTSDATYLHALREALSTTFRRFRPDVVVYLAGADPFRGDRLGRLALTREGLRERDREVLDACRLRSVPIAIAMAGGYTPDVETLVDLHLQTVVLACAPEPLRLPRADGARSKAAAPPPTRAGDSRD